MHPFLSKQSTHSYYAKIHTFGLVLYAKSMFFGAVARLNVAQERSICDSHTQTSMPLVRKRA